MPFDNAAKNLMLDELRAVGTRLHIHSDDPGAGNDNQVASNETGSWSAASGGSVALSANVSFDGMTGNQAVEWFSVWNAAGSVRYGKAAITTGDTNANAAGEYELTTATSMAINDS